MTPSEAFQVGFMMRCADEGLSAQQIKQRIQTSVQLFQKEALLSGLTSGLTTAGLVVPVGLGLGGGYLAAKLRESDVDEEAVKRKELIDEYRRLTAEARRQAKLKMIRSNS